MKIKSIEETSWSEAPKNWYSTGYDGFIVTLEDDKQLKLGISNGQSCCEHWGYIISEDSYHEFIGAEYHGVEVVNEKLETVELEGVYEGSCMFVNINTSEGVLQFVAYNEHNGYYGHEAVVVEDGTITHSESL
ncbi:hypothetical protein 16Q_010c [Pseudomonas phage 16Q]|nr:hypothetical protein 16Q_010c [Pseudomonas phage 16Q]